MLRAWQPEAVREHERATGDLFTSGALMQRAADAVAGVVADRVGEHGRVVALVGAGDNGADTLWALERLASGRVGRPVPCTALLLVEDDQREAVGAALRAGVELAPVGADTLEGVGAGDVVLDGMVGLGGRPGLGGRAALLAEGAAAARSRGALVLAVDLPSGLDPLGRAVPTPGDHVGADLTLALVAPKPVHLAPATTAACGELLVDALGTGTPSAEHVLESWQHDDLAAAYPVPGRTAHKYTRGALGVAAGSDTYPGAAVLCCTGALGAGTGMVRYLGPRRAQDLVLASCPEVVPGEGRVQAWVLGPGCPEEDTDRQRGLAQLARRPEPAVLDAGALHCVAVRPADAVTLLTPHAGELAAMLGWRREEVEADPEGAGSEASRRWDATVLVKGAVSVVVPSVAERRRGCVPVTVREGTSWLATAGTGDVLAGVLGALLAAGLAAVDAAVLGAALHARAGARLSGGGPIRAAELGRAMTAEVRDLLG
ncbi:hypothetical protein HMPREF3099_02385 [Kytococcus sp. HMSC28H12]|nr:hypothetical protein HMPREF3099_02385 [Kytococcus sp. HMSC28H12]